MLSACTRLVAGTANSEPPRVFPNLDEFTAVSSAEYEHLQHWGNTVYFEAPSGIRCSLSGYFTMTCTHIPFDIQASDSGGNPAGCKSVGPVTTPSRASGNTYHFYRQSEPCGAGDQDMFKPLPDQSKISLEVDGSPLFTCAAKGTDLVACIANDENHGFVLRPSGSWTF